MFSFLYKHFADQPPAEDSETPTQKLYNAAAAGNAEVVSKLIRDGVDYSAVNVGGNKPIHIAAYEGHVPVLEILLDAARNNHAAAVTFLIAHGADVTAQNWRALEPAQVTTSTDIGQIIFQSVDGAARQASTSPTSAPPHHPASVPGHAVRSTPSPSTTAAIPAGQVPTGPAPVPVPAPAPAPVATADFAPVPVTISAPGIHHGPMPVTSLPPATSEVAGPQHAVPHTHAPTSQTPLVAPDISQVPGLAPGLAPALAPGPGMAPAFQTGVPVSMSAVPAGSPAPSADPISDTQGAIPLLHAQAPPQVTQPPASSSSGDIHSFAPSPVVSRAPDVDSVPQVSDFVDPTTGH